MGITASGIGSGLDINSLVSQLIAAERQKFAPKAQRSADFKDRISQYGTIKSNLAGLQDAAKKLRELATGSQKTTNTNPENANVSLAKGIVGTFSINITALASRQTLQSRSFGTTGEISGSDNSTETLTIDFGGGVTSAINVTASAGSTSLTIQDVADAINADMSLDGKVSARVESFAPSAGAPLEKRLIIEADRSGADLSFTVTGTNELAALNYANANTADVTKTQSASDAAVTINGVNYTSTSNEINNAVSGLSLSALKTGTTTVTGTFGVDNATVKTRVTEFVTAYNNAIGNLKQSQTKDARLGRESTPSGIETSIRSLMGLGADVGGGVTRFVSDFGLRFDKDGVLYFDDPAKFDAAVTADSNAAVKFLGSTQSGDAGLLSKLDGYLKDVLGTEGVIAQRNKSLDAAMRRIEEDRVRFVSRLDKLEDRLFKQFSALDASLAGLQSSQNLLQQRLSALQQ